MCFSCFYYCFVTCCFKILILYLVFLGFDRCFGTLRWRIETFIQYFCDSGLPVPRQILGIQAFHYNASIINATMPSNHLDSVQQLFQSLISPPHLLPPSSQSSMTLISPNQTQLSQPKGLQGFLSTDTIAQPSFLQQIINVSSCSLQISGSQGSAAKCKDQNFKKREWLTEDIEAGPPAPAREQRVQQ